MVAPSQMAYLTGPRMRSAESLSADQARAFPWTAVRNGLKFRAIAVTPRDRDLRPSELAATSGCSGQQSSARPAEQGR
jgi:hypothetical protein